MNRTTRSALSAAAFAALVAGGTWFVAQSTPTAVAQEAQHTEPAGQRTHFAIDPVHTAVIFGTQYMGMGNFYGQFTDYSGFVEYDGQNPESFKTRIEIPVESIDTHNEQRDQHLKSPDFFNAREYPTITFVSTGLTDNGDGTYKLTGDLTLHGVTKSIETTVTNLKSKDTPTGFRTGFGTEFRIKRSDFGINMMIGDNGIGDEVVLIVGVQSVVAQ